MQQDVHHRFITHLENLAGIAPGSNPDRRALAALRRTLATWPSVPAEALRVVAPYVPEHAVGWRETVHYLIAALFALHPCPSAQETNRAPGLGRALREAAARDTSQGPERRLLALLGCRSEDLPNHLRHAISYLRARDVAVDYRRLMRDLLRWDAGEGEVQRRWGRDFWAGMLDENTQPSAPNTVQEDTNVH